MSLDKEIRALTQGVYPMHMPGHKRNPNFIDVSSALDITEISGADNLQSPSSIIKAAEEKTARLFGVYKTFYLTNGSTSGILGAINGTLKEKDKIILSRNCHKSVYNGAVLRKLKTLTVEPELDAITNAYGKVSPERIEKALKSFCAKAVVITSPTYEGVVSDVKAIADICHKYNCLLIVDEAHGSHLSLNSYFPESARHLGADIVIESCHKTLPCLTSTALLHICNEKIDLKKIKDSLNLFSTTSPSYPLICSIDSITDLLEKKGKELFDAYAKRLDDFYTKAKMLKFLKIYEGNASSFDKGKLMVLCKNTNINGFELKRRLLEEYKIECEMAMPDYALAMTSIADTDEGFNRLLSALIEIDGTLEKAEKEKLLTPKISKKKKEIYKALEKRCRPIDLEKSVGKTSAEFVFAYPPGSPIILPGEIIIKENLDYLLNIQALGGEVNSSKGNFPKAINII